ncbi:MAG: hypothetical protein QOI20_218 [Acidimicrobiaceae bacterium]|jgi:uncharacterized damage-inducible protein DinB|nr:hypothetical protein [Acidimicrobiaceae bacterium]
MPGSEHVVLIDRLKTTARDLVSLTSGVTRAALDRRPAPREWSAAMVLTHLAEAELVYANRIKLALVEDRPHFPPVVPDAIVERLSRVDEDVKETLARWRVNREHAVRLLESLEEPEWRRPAVHPTRGELSLRQVVSLLADHDRNHLDQLRKAVSG